MATALSFPVLAALNAAAILPPSVLPLAILGIVTAHTVHLLAGQLAAAPTRASTASG